MVKKIATIDIVEVDIETVEKDDSSPDAYAFYINLSAKPEPQWIKIFDFEWSRTQDLLKREMEVVGDKLRLVCGADDNLQNHVALAKRLVKRTNERVEEDNRRIELLLRRSQGVGEEVDEDKEEIRRKLREMSQQ